MAKGLFSRTKEIVDTTTTDVQQETAQVYQKKVFAFLGMGGSGSSTLASLFAQTLARAGRKTVLVDGNFAFPSLYRFFRTTKLSRENSVFRYFTRNAAPTDLNVKVATEQNLWLVSAFPSDAAEQPERLHYVTEPVYNQLLDYQVQTFDAVVYDLPIALSIDHFLAVVNKLDTGFLVWDEQTERATQTEALVRFVGTHSPSLSTIAHVVLNKRTREAYDYSALQALDLALVAEFPFLRDLPGLKNRGESLLDTPKLSPQAEAVLQRLVDYTS